jgi:hypothetical protein
LPVTGITLLVSSRVFHVAVPPGRYRVRGAFSLFYAKAPRSQTPLFPLVSGVRIAWPDQVYPYLDNEGPCRISSVCNLRPRMVART